MTGEEGWSGDLLRLDQAPSEGTSTDAESVRPGGLLSGKYRLDRFLRRSGLGQIYLATQLPLGRRVSVKIAPAAKGAETRRRFALEAEACSRSASPHAVVLYDYDLTPRGEPYLVTESLSGISLDEVLEISRPLKARRAIDVAIQAATGVAALHRAGFVHRDVKPSNLMLDRDPETQAERLKICDFGLVKRVGFGRPPSDTEDLTRPEVRLGSPLYMAPEQIQGGTVTAASDVYGLGAVLFEMLTGAPPINSPDPLEVMHRQLRELPPGLRERGADLRYVELLQPILSKCLEKAPAQRYASARDLRMALLLAHETMTRGAFPSSNTSGELIQDLELASLAAPGGAPVTGGELSEDLFLPPEMALDSTQDESELSSALLGEATAIDLPHLNITEPEESTSVVPELEPAPPLPTLPPPDRGRLTPIRGTGTLASAEWSTVNAQPPRLSSSQIMPASGALRSRRSRRLPPDLRRPAMWLLGGLLVLCAAAAIFMRG